jgi:hypothetical protein
VVSAGCCHCGFDPSKEVKDVGSQSVQLTRNSGLIGDVQGIRAGISSATLNWGSFRVFAKMRRSHIPEARRTFRKYLSDPSGLKASSRKSAVIGQHRISYQKGPSPVTSWTSYQSAGWRHPNLRRQGRRRTARGADRRSASAPCSVHSRETQLDISKQAAVKAFSRALRANTKEDIPSHRRSELGDLDLLEARCWEVIADRSTSWQAIISAVGSMTRLHARRARLLGLDAPQKVDCGTFTATARTRWRPTA